MRDSIKIAALIAFALILGNGCDAVDYTTLDIGIPGPIGYCRLNQGDLEVVVVNQGTQDAVSNSTTRVDFGTYGFSDLPTAPLPAGVSTTLGPIPIPFGCYDSDCEFKITVDLNGDIAEGNEDNNVADGICIG